MTLLKRVDRVEAAESGPWGVVLFCSWLAFPACIALVYALLESTNLYFTAAIAVAVAALLLVRFWQTACVFVPVLLFFIVVVRFNDQSSRAQTLSLSLIVLLLIRGAWWWVHHAANEQRDSHERSTAHRSRYRFGLLGILWFAAVVSVLGALTVEMHVQRVEQAEYERLHRDLAEVGGFIIRRSSKYNRTLEFRSNLLRDEKLAELIDRVREKYGVRYLILDEQPISDAAMEAVAKLDDLEELELQGTNVTDTGVSALTHLRLRRLDLSRTAITDAAVEHLKQMPPLGALHIEETALSHEAVEELRDALPSTSIYWSPPNPSPATGP